MGIFVGIGMWDTCFLSDSSSHSSNSSYVVAEVAEVVEGVELAVFSI